MNAPDSIITTTRLTVSYEGEGVVDNTIAVDALVPALSALDRLFLRSNGIINGAGTQASLRLSALRAGSFEVELLLLVSYASNVLAGPFITPAANLMQLVVGSTQGLGAIGVFKRLRGRTPTVVERNPDFVTIEADQLRTGSVEARGIRLNIPVSTAEVAEDSVAWRIMHDVFAPLQSPEINKMTFREENAELVSLESGDVDRLEETSAQDQPDVSEISTRNLTVVSPNFENSYAKWSLKDGQTTNWYSIADESFLQRVSEGQERFGADDILVCRVKITRKISGENRPTNDYQVIEVISHEPQMRLFSQR